MRPEADRESFRAFPEPHLPRSALTDTAIESLFAQFGPGQFNLSDRGYLARVHPLQLWPLEYLSRHPQASLNDVFAASEKERQEVYECLFRTRSKAAQDLRIRTMPEIDAFREIHGVWKRQGYRSDSLVSSFATAIGSSGDTRLQIYGSRGRQIGSRVMNRTATFVFFIGDRFFGTTTAFVPGKKAEAYEFTSALPVQAFKHLIPAFVPLVEGEMDSAD